MIFIDRKTIDIPEVFYSKEIEIARKRMEDFYSRDQTSRSQEKYYKPFEPELRNRFLDALRNLFNGKCAYCESFIPLELTRSEYDHFRPKSGARGLEKEFSNDHYWWLTYEWDNLYYSCANCNQYKSTWFPVEGNRVPIGTPHRIIINTEKSLLIDPCYDKPEDHLTYNEQGEISFLTAKGQTTIEILKLNRAELVLSRKKTIADLQVKWTLVTTTFNRKRPNKEILKEIHQEWESLFTQPSPKAYLGLQRFMLSKWLNNRPDIQDYLQKREYNNETTNPVITTKLVEEIKLIPKEKLEENARIEISNTIGLESIRHVYVEKIELKNFKCFSQLELDFSNNSGINYSKNTESNPLTEPWILFLGENGVGKSSLLKALAIGLTGKEYIKELGIKGKEILKHNAEDGYIKIHLVGSTEPIKVTFTETSIETTLYSPIVNILAYNSIRLKPTLGKMVPENNVFYGAKVKNLFDYTFSLVDADNWLATLGKDVFDRAALTLKDLMLLDNDDKIVIKDYKAVVVRGNDEFYIDELSDGYKSIFFLAVDIMATLASENVTFDLAEGMVLIDEIGTHLHPRWRMEVVGRLRKAFPKIRFVVTTHEPLCLRGLVAGETVVLTKNEEKEIIALTDLPDPSEYRIDQILTSDFFGLKSTIDPKTEKLFDEYYAILALDEENRTEPQKNRLLELSTIIPKIKHLGDNLREELVYYVVDELLAKKTRDDGLKIKADLKQEAKKRIESLWNTISKKEI